MSFERAQTVFTTGEVDPRLRSRFDLERYQTAGATMRDCLPLPHGGFDRRPGTVLDDDDEGIPTWIVPFKMAALTVLKNPSTSVGTETFTWSSIAPGSDEVSDNEIAFDQAYNITHVFATAISVASDRSADFDVRFEFWDNARSNWVATPYCRVHLEAADTQEGGGGNLVQLSDQADEGLRVGGFTKMRAKIRDAPDASVSLSVTFDFRAAEGSSLELSRARKARFNVSETEQFMVLFTDECVTVFEQETDAGTGERQLVQRATLDAPWSAADIQTIDWVQALDTMIVVHEDAQPRKLVREGENEFWALSTITFDSDFVVEPDAIHIPQDPVDDAGADNAGKDEIWRVEFIGFSAGDAYQIIVDGFLTEPKDYSNTAADNTTRIQDALDSLSGVLSGNFSVTNPSGDVYEIKYSHTDLSQKPVIDTFEAQVDEGAGFMAAWKTQKGRAYSNDKWSATKGWPRSVTLYQDRLWFGGAKSYPDEGWGSRVGDIFSFWNDENLDNEAIPFKLRSDQLLNIRAIFPGRNLQVFTDAQEFFVPQSTTQPLTPDTFQIIPATNRGIAIGVPPLEVTGATIFLEANKDSVREFLFIDTEQSYNAQDVSLLSSSLLSDPLAQKRWRSKSGQEYDLVFFPNGANADMAVFASLRDQGITGWFRWSGDWRDVEVIQETLYGIRRTDINGDDVNVIARFDTDAHMDLLTSDPAVTQSISNGIVDGLYIQKGKEGKVKIDGSYVSTETLDSGNADYTGAGNPQLDTGEVIDESYQVGQQFQPLFKQLPTAIQTEGGLIWADRKKRIRKAIVDVIDSYAIEISTLADQSNFETVAVEANMSTSSPPLQSGRIRTGGRLGWDDEAALSIRQSLPYPMRVLAVQTWVDL